MFSISTVSAPLRMREYGTDAPSSFVRFRCVPATVLDTRPASFYGPLLYYDRT